MSPANLPLKSQHMDPMFWAKLTALWHRERMRDLYVKTGEEPHEARHRANREALEIARKHGWAGQLPQLKAAPGLKLRVKLSEGAMGTILGAHACWKNGVLK